MSLLIKRLFLMEVLVHLSSYRSLWSIAPIRWLCIARFLSLAIFYSTVLVQYQASRGLNYTEMFLLESIISIAAWLFDIPTGLWADRAGYRPVLIVGYCFTIV